LHPSADSAAGDDFDAKGEEGHRIKAGTEGQTVFRGKNDSVVDGCGGGYDASSGRGNNAK
jgi:hypothetical protein